MAWRRSFFALNLLVIDRIADDVVEAQLHNGISGLIITGEQLAREIAERF